MAQGGENVGKPASKPITDQKAANKHVVSTSARRRNPSHKTPSKDVAAARRPSPRPHDFGDLIEYSSQFERTRDSKDALLRQQLPSSP